MRMKKNRFICFICMLALLVSMLVMPVMADGTRVVTLGVDLTDEQEAFIINYFGVDLSTARVIYVNNQQEREYVGSWIPIEQIGDMTISSAYVQPTNSGGIQVKTANLTYVTGNMIASVMSTAGVKNCNIVAAAPFPVSGTGALTGVMIAYQEATGTQLEDSKKDLAVQEFVVTQQASQSIGEPEALQLVNAVKAEVVQSAVPADDTEQIQQIVDKVVSDMDQSLEVNGNGNSVNMDESVSIDNSVTNIDNSVTTINNGLTEEDRQMIIDLATKIAAEGYEYEDLRSGIEQTESNLRKETGMTVDINITNESSPTITTDVNTDNSSTSDASAENSPENILNATHDELIDVENQSSNREADIEAIEEAKQAEAENSVEAQADNGAFVMHEEFYSSETDVQPAQDGGQVPNEVQPQAEVPAPEAVQPQAEVPAPDVVQPQDEVPAPDVVQPQDEVPAPEAVQPQDEVPAPEAVQPQDEVPAPDEVQPQAEVPAPDVVQPQDEVPAPDEVQPQDEIQVPDEVQPQDEGQVPDEVQPQDEGQVPDEVQPQDEGQIPDEGQAPDEEQIPNEEQVPDVAGSGEWTVTANTSIVSIPDAAQSVWDQTYPVYDEMDLTAIACLGSQIVNGTNYQFLCVGTPQGAGPDEMGQLYVAVVYQDLEGTSTIISSLTAFDLDELEARSNPETAEELPLGGWSMDEIPQPGNLEQFAATAFSAMVGQLPADRNVIPVAELASKSAGGTEYAILCCEEGTEESSGCYEVAFIYTDEAGNYQYHNLVKLDLADYNN